MGDFAISKNKFSLVCFSLIIKTQITFDNFIIQFYINFIVFVTFINVVSRHEKSCKPANLVCGHYYLKMWTLGGKTTHEILSRKYCNLWIYRHSVINSTLCRQVIILRRGSHSVDKPKFCRYVHMILTSPYCILKIGPFLRIITWTFST